MKHLYLLLCLVSPLPLFSQTNILFPAPYVVTPKAFSDQEITFDRERFYIQGGASFGTFASENNFQANSFSFEIETKLFYALDHLAVGFGFSYNYYPAFDYLDRTINLNYTSPGIELILHSRNHTGFILSAGLEYPYEIDDSDYFDEVTLVSSSIEKTRNLTPMIGLGYAFEANRTHQILLSFKYLSYTNYYRFLDEPSQLRFYRSDEVNIGIIQLTWRIQWALF